MSETEWVTLLERLQAMRFRAAIVGPKGSGKTTLLEDLAQRLRLHGHIFFIRLSRERPHLPVTPPFRRSDIVFCDGAEQLNGIGWWKLRMRTAHAGGLIITTHRPGRLRTLIRCSTSPALLRQLTESLGSPISHSESERLWRDYDGNLRLAIGELYDRARVSPPH